MTRRLTPAQKRALHLLATPGAEARDDQPGSVFRWSVYVNDEPAGSIHADTLETLRMAGLVQWIRFMDSFPVQRITARGLDLARELRTREGG